jgi:hypothetical protein
MLRGGPSPPQQGRPGPVNRCNNSSGDEGLRDGAFAAPGISWAIFDDSVRAVL